MTPNVVILTLDASTERDLARVLGMRASAGAIVLQTIEGAVSKAIERARREHGALPIAVAARTRAEAFEAIEAGADEAMAVAADDRAQIVELIDRARLRGTMRAEIERERRDVAQADKLAALGTLVAGVAHEVNNPLSAIMLLLDLFPNDGSTTAEVASELRRSVGTIQDVVKDLRVFARDGESEHPQVVSIPATLDHLLRLIGAELRSVAVVERDFDADLPEVLVPETRLTQVLTNVLVNATQAMRETKRETHRLKIVARADEQNVALSISDTGPGIAPETVDRIFDPFFTTKRERLGTGLGLSISRNLMRKMGGDLLVESMFGEGATFILLLPRSSSGELRQARLRSRVVSVPASATRRRSVLVATDDETLLRVYARVLGRWYDVLLAADAREAIDLLASGSHAEATLVDLVGTEAGALATWLVANRPPLARRIVLVSNDAEILRRHESLAAMSPQRLTKPTPSSSLLGAIEAALDRESEGPTHPQG